MQKEEREKDYRYEMMKKTERRKRQTREEKERKIEKGKCEKERI